MLIYKSLSVWLIRDKLRCISIFVSYVACRTKVVRVIKANVLFSPANVLSTTPI